MTFSLYPADGKSFDVKSIREIVASHPFAVEFPAGSGRFYVEADEPSARYVRDVLGDRGGEALWVVQVFVEPGRIHVGTEARQEALESVEPILSRILATSPVGRIASGEAADLRFPDVESAIRSLLG